MTLESAAFLEGLIGAKVFLEAEAMVKERETAAQIRDRAKSLVHVLSGKTRDSIEIQGEGTSKGMPYVDVGTRLPEAIAEEYGNSHSPAHPFMRPAIAEVRR